MATRAI